MRYNLVVAGGGLSGVAAAISAAREGLNVLLVEKSGCLGGAIANNLVYPFMPYWTKPYWDKSIKRNYLSQGIFKKMIADKRSVQSYIRIHGTLKGFKDESIVFAKPL